MVTLLITNGLSSNKGVGMHRLIAVLVVLVFCLSSGSAFASARGASPSNSLAATSILSAKTSRVTYPPSYKPKKVVIPAYWVYRIVKCGGGGYLGYISSAGWKWYQRAVSVTFGCILAI